MPDTSPSWNDGQVAALVLLASSLLGNVLPNPFATLPASLPVLSALSLWVAFPLFVMVPVVVAVAARASGRDRSAWVGIKLGSVVCFLTTVIVLVAYVAGLALGQPQLLKIGLSWDSLRDAALIVAVTTAVGAALSTAGAVAAALTRLARGGPDVPLSR